MKYQKIESIEQLLEMAERKASASSNKWWCFTMFTDSLKLDVWDKCVREEILNVWQEEPSRVLELHIFSCEAEYRAFRGSIGQKLICSLREDDEQEYFDEIQYLDIDIKSAQKQPNGGWQVRTAGGGTYHLPLERVHAAAIVIRNYVAYHEKSGQAYVSDWRIVELREGEE